MINAVIDIIIGIVIWQCVPGWIKYGPTNIRQAIQMICNIIGIIITILGVIQLIKAIVR